MATAVFHLPDGTSRTLDLPLGASLMEAAREHSVDGIVADCGGGAICGTCHVVVHPQWFPKLEAANNTELALVEFAPESCPTSRLSCQLVMTAERDGIEVTVPSEQIPY